MAETLSLLEFVRALFKDDDLRENFSNHPERTLTEHGLSNLSPTDVYDACVLVEDNETTDYDRHIHFSPPSHHRHRDDDDHDDHDHDRDRDHDHDHKHAVEYLNRYFTKIDDRDPKVDNSVHQKVDTDGGDFDQHVDVDSQVVSGDGAIGAGGDIRNATLTTGEDNTIGDHNVEGRGNVVGHDNDAVTGSRNTTAFGEGDAERTDFGDVRVGAGGGFATGGNSTVDNTDNSVDHSHNDESDHSTSGSHNTESEYTSETDNSLDHVGNTHTETTETTDNSLHHVGNYEVDA